MAAKSIVVGVRPVVRMFSSVSVKNSGSSILKHRPTMPSNGVYPLVGPDVFIAPSATVVGHVELVDGSSVWYNAVIRGDQNKVHVGFNSVIGDRVTITTAASLDSGFPAEVLIEQGVTVGAGSALRSCTIEMGASIGENCVIGEVWDCHCCFDFVEIL
jgi:carbonic anhydrase/acetyltransferase-like protein (isoleucine patch superfamily)